MMPRLFDGEQAKVVWLVDAVTRVTLPSLEDHGNDVDFLDINNNVITRLEHILTGAGSVVVRSSLVDVDMSDVLPRAVARVRRR